MCPFSLEFNAVRCFNFHDNVFSCQNGSSSVDEHIHTYTYTQINTHAHTCTTTPTVIQSCHQGFVSEAEDMKCHHQGHIAAKQHIHTYSPVYLGFDLEEIVRETILVFLSPRYILEYRQKKFTALTPCQIPKISQNQPICNTYCDCWCYGPYFRLNQSRICTFLWVFHTIHRCKMNRYG